MPNLGKTKRKRHELKNNLFGIESPDSPGSFSLSLSDSVDNIKRMEDAGAAAVVLHSLFEEHISFERHQLQRHFAKEMEGLAEQLNYSSQMNRLTVGPESYLDEIAAAKSAVSIPIIASLNGSTLVAGPIMRSVSKKPAPMHLS